jgi:hypothetical protein
MNCAYLNDGTDGKAHQLDRAHEQRLVLDADIDEMDQLLAQSFDLSYCLEYAAQLGKHAVTQHLLWREVPVTRQAVVNAARRRGPGLDMLFSGVRAQDKPNAWSAGMSFRMSAKDFEKAYEMLDAGVAPDKYFISAAFSGAQSADDFELIFQDALDRVLVRIAPEVLAESHLELLVEYGRPIHIERTLEKLGQQVRALMPRILALGSDGPAKSLRSFGATVNDDAIAHCSQHMNWVALESPDRYLERLCKYALADGFEGCIHVESVRPILEALLTKRAQWLRRGAECAPATYDRVRLTFEALIPCIIPEERAQLHTIIDRWNAGQPADIAFTEEGLTDIHAIIDAIDAETLDLGSGPSR